MAMYPSPQCRTVQLFFLLLNSRLKVIKKNQAKKDSNWNLIPVFFNRNVVDHTNFCLTPAAGHVTGSLQEAKPAICLQNIPLLKGVLVSSWPPSLTVLL